MREIHSIKELEEFTYNLDELGIKIENMEFVLKFKPRVYELFLEQLEKQHLSIVGNEFVKVDLRCFQYRGYTFRIERIEL